MKKSKAVCVSCGSQLIEKGVIFKCPSCGREIARCDHCRKRGIKYECECGFEGP